MTHEAFIRSLKLRNFRPAEIERTFVGAKRGIQNEAPPVSLWINIVPTLVILDALREVLTMPIRITSTYRTPAYNRAVGGVRRSTHLDYRAIDFRVVGLQASRAAYMLRQWRGRPFPLPVPVQSLHGSLGPYYPAGLQINHTPAGAAFVFAGGIGEYATFVHLDTRGHNATW